MASKRKQPLRPPPRPKKPAKQPARKVKRAGSGERSRTAAKKPTAKRTTTKKVQSAEVLAPPRIVDALDKPETDEGAWDADGLTTRQHLFVAALIGPAGGNATRAAEMAGYRADNRAALAVTASRLLIKANVQRAIAHAFAKLRDTPEWARAALVDLASTSMANCLEMDDEGNIGLDFRKAAEMGAIGQIKEYTEDTIGKHVLRRKIKLHDRGKALETLLKLHGKLVERHELSGPAGAPIQTATTVDLSGFSDAELERIARAFSGGRVGTQEEV